jgi:hypothetical protein
MNQPIRSEMDDDLRPEYDFSQGVRGKHYQAFRKGTNVVLLDDDVAKVFRDSESVNQARVGCAEVRSASFALLD